MKKLNYSNKNVNIISFIISLIIFFILINLLNYFSFKSNVIPSKNQNENIKSENTNNTIKQDIVLEEIKNWKIEIERLNQKADIKEGVEENVIKENVGHYTTSNYLYGKVMLKAYNTGEYKNYFANLKDLEIGDEIKYIINEKEYKYKVISNLIIEKESEMQIETESENSLILITYIKDMPTKLRCVIGRQSFDKN